MGIGSTVLSYGTMWSLAVQSSRLEQSMNKKLLQMTIMTEQAISFQDSSIKSQAESMEQQQAATIKEAKAVELHQEATILMEQSHADTIMADSEQVQVDELKIQIVEEENESAIHAAAAAMDEETVEMEVSEATVHAEEATQLELQVEGDEVGIVVCEWIPLLDIVCDVVGGITALGWQADAVAVAAKSSTEFATATIAQTKEDTELEQVTEDQAELVETSQKASELQVQVQELSQVAETERYKAEEDEVAAEQFEQQASIQEESAMTEQVEAETEQIEAETLFQQALEQGVRACWDGILANVVSFFALIYFSVRVLSMVVVKMLVPILVSVVQSTTTTRRTRREYNNDSTNVTTTTTTPMKLPLPDYHHYNYEHEQQQHYYLSLSRNVSYIIHHGGIFIWTLAAAATSNGSSSLWLTTTTPQLGQYDDSSIHTRGGFVILFAMIGGTLQVIGLHAVPRAVLLLSTNWPVTAATTTATTTSVGSTSSSRASRWRAAGHALLSLLVEMMGRAITLTLLFGMEFLIFWVNFGSQAVSPIWLQNIYNYYPWWMGWMFLTLTLGIHGWYLELPYHRHHHHQQQQHHHSCTATTTPTQSSPTLPVVHPSPPPRSHHPSCSKELEPLLVSKAIEVTSPPSDDDGCKDPNIGVFQQSIFDNESSSNISLTTIVDQMISSSSSSGSLSYGTNSPTVAATTTTTTILLESPSKSCNIHPLPQQHHHGDSEGNHEYKSFSFGQELSKLQVPLEILMVSCMVAIFCHCLGHVRDLWPTSQSLLRHTPPDEWVGMSVAAGIVLLLFVVVTIVEQRCHVSRGG